MGKSPWSIATAVRNPNRLKGLLGCLRQFDGHEWHKANQINYQIALIQERLFGYGNPQFYSNLEAADIDLLDDLSHSISFAEAEFIFHKKDYTDPAMRGRQSLNPLKKLGFVSIENRKIKITPQGKQLLLGKQELGVLFLQSFLKWQIPNPSMRLRSDKDAYDIKPFMAVMHLISAVNAKEKSLGNKPKGISKREFCLFANTLLHHNDIEKHAEAIMHIRSKGVKFDSYKKTFLKKFNGGNSNTKKLERTLIDYGDNAIRCFRLTGYFYIRGGGFYIDLESRRLVEINALLKYDSAGAKSFQSTKDYAIYMGDPEGYQLPWKNKSNYTQIIKSMLSDIKNLERELSVSLQAVKPIPLDIDGLENYIAELRKYRSDLQNSMTQQYLSDVAEIKKRKLDFVEIYKKENRPLFLEKLSTESLYAINDALEIKPNYPIGDDNAPTCTAPGNVPDIECFYQDFNAICEVTMLTGRNQWYNEGQPVMRHLRAFEGKYSDVACYCLFLAPKIHTDTLNTFWNSVKYAYEGSKQKIIPLSFVEFSKILDTQIALRAQKKSLKQGDIQELYDAIIAFTHLEDDSQNWLKAIPGIIENWQNSFSESDQ